MQEKITANDWQLAAPTPRDWKRKLEAVAEGVGYIAWLGTDYFVSCLKP